MVWWILIFPTSRLPPRWAILRWGILISRYINIAHPGYNTIFLSCMPLSRIQNSPNSIFDLVFHFWDQLNTLKTLTNSAQFSVIIMNSTKYIFNALLLLIEVLGFDLNKFSLFARPPRSEKKVSGGGDRGWPDCKVDRPGPDLGWRDDHRREDEESFCYCQLGANTGELYCSFTFANDRVLRF